MDIYHLIDNQDKFNEMTLKELDNLVDRYPFFHTARMLYLINLFKLHKPELSAQLTKASILIPDRTVLFNAIEGSNYQLEKVEKPAEEYEKQQHDTIELIDQFLENNDTIEGNDIMNVPHDKPTIAELTNDYAAFLISQEDIDTDNDVGDGQQDEIIDSFLNANLGRQRYDLEQNNQNPVGPDNSENNDDFYNENIVNIYIKQGRYQHALKILNQICLNNPEKSANFAAQIKLLNVVINNKNNQ